MLKEEKDSLLEYMSSNPFRNMTDLYFFFKEFSKYNINSVSTLKRSPKAFHNFLVKNKKYIIDSDPNRIEHLIDSATNFLESNVLSALYGPHQRYVDIVNGFFSGGEHLLDVGPGEFAGSSILFTKKHNKMSAMDDCFRLSDESLKKMGIESHNKFFTDSTDVSSFDALVGRHPCSAILHMVRASAKENKPYIIELCDCEIPRFYDILTLDLPDMDKIDVAPLLKRVVYDKVNERISPYFDWSDILPLYDKNCKVVGGFATNLDLTNESFVRHLAKYGISSKPRPIFTDSDFRDMHNDKSTILSGKLNIAVENSDTDFVTVVRHGEQNGSKFWKVEKDAQM